MKKITVAWDGKEYTIDEDQVFELGEEIEDIITLTELVSLNDKPKFRKLSRCYSIAVNFAGGSCSPEEVFSVMMSEVKNRGTHGKQFLVAQMGAALIDILMDGAPEDGEEGGESDEEGKKAAS